MSTFSAGKGVGVGEGVGVGVGPGVAVSVGVGEEAAAVPRSGTSVGVGCNHSWRALRAVAATVISGAAPSVQPARKKVITMVRITRINMARQEEALRILTTRVYGFLPIYHIAFRLDWGLRNGVRILHQAGVSPSGNQFPAQIDRRYL